MVASYVATFSFSPFWLEILSELKKNWTMAQESAEDDLSSSWSPVSKLSRSASSVESQKASAQDNPEPIPVAATSKFAEADGNGGGDSNVRVQIGK